ncbi:MAG: YoaP domain-containing protein [Paracoccaceae bacterium]
MPEITTLTLTPQTLPDAHICCAIADRKCDGGTAAKKAWLAERFTHGYRFRRLDVRGKVFIEYGPAEEAWQPIDAPGWMALGCFWVSGRFKRSGHAKALLADVGDAAQADGMAGIVAVAGRRKMAFLSDGAWLRRQGFEEVDALDTGFVLLARPCPGGTVAPRPRFARSCREAVRTMPKGVVAYYSDRCPFAQYHVTTSLRDSCARRGLDLTIRHLDSAEAARAAPSPATVFSLFVDGRFATSDLSACLDTRFDKALAAAGLSADR